MGSPQFLASSWGLDCDTPLSLPLEGQTGVGPRRSPVSARAEQDGGERGLEGWFTW